MAQPAKSGFYDWIRPLHAPFTKALRRRLGRNYWDHPEMDLPPPFDAIQLDIERHLHEYLHVSRDDISQVVIVGASDASEVDRLHRSYPRAKFLCFEPNPNTFGRLNERFGGMAHVSLSNRALGKAPGKAQFHELPMPGNGSLLEPDMELWKAFGRQDDEAVECFEVEVSTLDSEAASLPAIDLVWMDVQGAEGDVLTGGRDVLKRTESVFVEIALVRSPYKGTLLFPQLSKQLEAEGFTCVGLGVDSWNGTGNAFFVNRLEERICRSPKRLLSGPS